MTFRATDIASWRFRSISLRISFEGPRRRIVHALGTLHFRIKVKYSSPIFSISKRPHWVPMSDSWRSSTRLTIVAPVARAMRLLSVFRTRLNAVTLCLTRKCWARSETPFSVMTRSGLRARMASHMCFTCSSSIWRMRFQSSSLLISMLVWDSPFLYSSGQSSSMILGFSIFRLIFGCVMSLFNITPSKTMLSSISPPGTFSTFA